MALGEQTTTLDYHEELNPLIFDGDRLKPDVREKLLAYGRAFAEFAKIPETDIQDIYLTGGNANYNYTPYSDLDVHVIVSREKLAKDLEIPRTWLDDYFADKKTLWTLKHEVKVYGIGLEPYAEDTEMMHPEGMGVYSLENDRWIVRPKLDLSVREILKSSAFATKMNATRELIDDLLTTEAPVDEFEQLKEKLRNMRRSGLEKGGEFSIENLVFKGLRNEGYLERVSDYVSGKLNVGLSLESITRYDENLLARENSDEPRIGDILETEAGPDPIKAAVVVREGKMWYGASIPLARLAMEDGSPGTPFDLPESESERIYEGYWTRGGRFVDRETAYVLSCADRLAARWGENLPTGPIRPEEVTVDEAIAPFLAVGRLMEAIYEEQKSPDRSGLL
jgi:hypothetical protein